MNALHKAVIYNRVPLAEPLLANDSRVDAIDTTGMTILMYAASKGSLVVAELLIKHKAQIDLKTKRGWNVWLPYKIEFLKVSFFQRMGVVLIPLASLDGPH